MTSTLFPLLFSDTSIITLDQSVVAMTQKRLGVFQNNAWRFANHEGANYHMLSITNVPIPLLTLRLTHRRKKVMPCVVA
jgi:hypothetical protein